jgi:hypothetical protein
VTTAPTYRMVQPQQRRLHLIELTACLAILQAAMMESANSPQAQGPSSAHVEDITVMVRYPRTVRQSDCKGVFAMLQHGQAVATRDKSVECECDSS